MHQATFLYHITFPIIFIYIVEDVSDIMEYIALSVEHYNDLSIG